MHRGISLLQCLYPTSTHSNDKPVLARAPSSRIKLAQAPLFTLLPDVTVRRYFFYLHGPRLNRVCPARWVKPCYICKQQVKNGIDNIRHRPWHWLCARCSAFLFEAVGPVRATTIYFPLARGASVFFFFFSASYAAIIFYWESPKLGR